jgi:glycyl-tRNA synthetase
VERESNLKNMSDLSSLCKRRGFLFQSSEIYGGVGGCWDYGPYGVELKNNIKQSWWKEMTLREDVVGIDSSILMHPKVWEASGHVEGFSDPLVDCKNCKERYRADNIDLQRPCPKCGAKDSFTDIRQFNLMFQTQLGAMEDSSSTIYLRPETAQGIFVNFLNVQATMRKKLPFGMAQIGKAFRNEITPGHFIFRTREFEQMEMQYFVEPGSQGQFMEQWRELRWNWHIKNGIRQDKMRWAPHGPDALAHYADDATDIEYEFPMGWGEMEGIHSRTNFDLSAHEKVSGKSLHYTDQAAGNKKVIPFVIETSVGCDRALLAVLCDAYRVENEGDKEQRTVLKLDVKLAPIKVAVTPLLKKPALEEVARKLFRDIGQHYKAEYDLAGSIGKRYRRQDEIGTPFCITVDFDTLEDGQVTIRDRDTMKQQRVALDQVLSFLNNNL